jgi:hypothetical protein
VLLTTLAMLVVLTMPWLGSDPWPFSPPDVQPRGLLGPLVSVADEEWDLGILRSLAVLAGVVVALAAALVWARPTWPRWAAIALAAVVVVALLVPATLLQVALRDATDPWYHTNDSTYQIELAGDLILDGENPYGHDYGDSGLERFYPAVGADPEIPQVALDHFAYFPGTPLTAAAWRLLPRPLDDYRLFVMLATFGLFLAALLYPAPLLWKLPVGALLAANPLAVRSSWFGTADAPALLALVLAFALLLRGRLLWAAAALGAAVSLKQFALVAAPFFVVMLLTLRAPRRDIWRAVAVLAGVVVLTALPFAIADPQAFWDDTIAYGADTYRIVGFGLSALLLNLGALDDRFGYYPFLPLAVFVWLPITAWLLVAQRRSGLLWPGAAGLAVSISLLFFLSRVFQNSYLFWPLTALALAWLLAVSRRHAAADSAPSARAG